MLFFYIIALIIVFCGLKNLKKGFLWLMVYKIFLVQNISLINVPGLPLLTMDVGLTLFYVFMFIVKRKKNAIYSVPFPYTKPFVFLAISWTLSAIFSRIGIGGAASQLLRDICQSLITVWMMWVLVEEKKDFRFLLKWFTFAFLIAGLYAYYEKAFEANPLQDFYVTLMGDSEKTIDFQYTNDVRGWRVKSVFEHPIGSGINFAMYVLFLLSSLYIYKIKVPNRHLSFFTMVLCVPCVLMSNSRGPILFLLIGLMMFVNLRDSKTYKLILLAIPVLALLMPLIGDYSTVVLSIFDSKTQADVGGSDANMRFEQLAASLALMMQSPLFGLGQKFQNVVNSYLVDALLGMESMWFRIMTTYGALGVLANLFSAYYAMYKVPKIFKSRNLFFIVLAYWVTGSLTSVPGILDHMYYLLLIYYIKNSEVYQHLRLRLQRK